MLRYVIKRIGIGLVTLLALIVVTFLLVHLMPGNPFDIANLTPSNQEEMMHHYGLDKPVTEQLGQYLVNLLRHTAGHDSFVRYMTEINFDILKKHYLAAAGKEELTQRETLYIRIYCLGTVSLTCEWLLGGYDASPETIAEIYENSLPEPLREVLNKKRENNNTISHSDRLPHDSQLKHPLSRI